MNYNQGKTVCKPKEVDYDENRIEVLNKHLQSLIDAGELQCASYCVSRYGKIFMHGSLGTKSFKSDDKTPLTPDCVNFVASITKVFTAVAVMKLVEDGRIRLDTGVGEILPQFNTPPFNGITLFQLLTHTSGMHADNGCFPNKYQSDYWDNIAKAYKLCAEDKKKDFDWIEASLGTIGSGFRIKPDTEWAYCSFGFTILGAVIEKITGLFAHKYIEDNICKPLKMNDTSFDITHDMAKRFIVSSLRDDIQERIDNALNGKTEE
ncbi:MAG: beta-lactamase family protein, partial [Treponema sp.]|nr:beta-lactamase family protein [Treponema sp.]